MLQPLELTGRSAIVTGAGRGIGRAITSALVRAGATALAVGRDESRLVETRDCLAREARACDILVADITTAEGRGKLAERLAVADILINNAAAFASYQALEALSASELARVIETNVLAPMQLVGMAMPGMKRRGFGRIVNIGSVAATLGAERQVAYATAKAALAGFTKSVALEGAPHGITCNLLELGLILTERIEEVVVREVRDRLIRSTPVGRAGSTADVARAVLFFVSPAADFLTGTILPVAGGLGLGLLSRCKAP